MNPYEMSDFLDSDNDDETKASGKSKPKNFTTDQQSAPSDFLREDSIQTIDSARSIGKDEDYQLEKVSRRAGINDGRGQQRMSIFMNRNERKDARQQNMVNLKDYSGIEKASSKRRERPIFQARWDTLMFLLLSFISLVTPIEIAFHEVPHFLKRIFGIPCVAISKMRSYFSVSERIRKNTWKHKQDHPKTRDHMAHHLMQQPTD